MALASLTEEIIADLPPYYRADQTALRLLDALAREVDRLQQIAVSIRDQFFLTRADDTYGLLAVHETVGGVSINPARALQARREAALGAVRRRFSPHGTDWRDAVTYALGTPSWSVIPNYPGDYELTIVVPFAQGTDEFDAVEPLLRPFTPAVYDLTITDDAGFVAGVSNVGEVPV